MNQQNPSKQNNVYYPHTTTQQSTTTTTFNNYQYYPQQHVPAKPASHTNTSSSHTNPTPYRILPPSTRNSHSNQYYNNNTKTTNTSSTNSVSNRQSRFNYNNHHKPTNKYDHNHTNTANPIYPSTSNTHTTATSTTSNPAHYPPRYQYNPSYPSTSTNNKTQSNNKSQHPSSSLHSPTANTAYTYQHPSYSKTDRNSNSNTTSTTYPPSSHYPPSTAYPAQASTYPYPSQTAPSTTAQSYYPPNMYPPNATAYPQQPSSHPPNYNYPPNAMYPPPYAAYPPTANPSYPPQQGMAPAPPYPSTVTVPPPPAPYPSVEDRYASWKASRFAIRTARRGRERIRPRERHDKYGRADRYRSDRRHPRDRGYRERDRDRDRERGHSRRDRDRDRERHYRDRDRDRDRDRRQRDRDRERSRRSKRSYTRSKSKEKETSESIEETDANTQIKDDVTATDATDPLTKADDNKLLINTQIQPQPPHNIDNTEVTEPIKEESDDDTSIKSKDKEEEDSSAIHAQLLASREPKIEDTNEEDIEVNQSNESDDEIDKKNIELRRNVDYEKFANHTVSVEGDDIPKCIEQFADALEDEKTTPILNNLKREHFSKPTPIQQHCLPILLQNRDVMACAQTGSGKTLAFLLPIIAQLLMAGEVNRVFFAGKTACCLPLALIMTPTRELTIQIDEQVYKMTRDTWIRSFAVYGGANYEDQAREIEKFQVDILCATPGRLMDMVDGCKVSLEYIKHLAFDEADNMLDLGFDDKVQQLVNERDMPDKMLRQTVMFSATFPDKIQQLAKDFMKEFVFVKVGHLESSPGPITQIVKWVEEGQKRDTLLKDIAECTGKIIVFCGRRQIADATCNYLKDHLDGESIGCLHGHMNQHCREEAILKFKDDQFRILCATSVAARGLDFPSIEKVINYDMPVSIQNYTHRIGRTGRIGSNGIAISYFNHTSRSLATPLLQCLKAKHQNVPHWLNEMVRK